MLTKRAWGTRKGQTFRIKWSAGIRKMAERVGFEPTSPVLPGYPLSRRALSTAQTPLRKRSLAEARFFGNPPRELSSRGKKTLHRLSAFFTQHALKNFGAVVERRMAENLKTGMHGAALRIVATID